MKIEKLSLEQLALIPQVRDEWLKIAMDTAPVDRAKVREILGRLYAFANKPVPNHIIHLDSPLQVSKAIANMVQKTAVSARRLARKSATKPVMNPYKFHQAGYPSLFRDNQFGSRIYQSQPSS